MKNQRNNFFKKHHFSIIVFSLFFCFQFLFYNIIVLANDDINRHFSSAIVVNANNGEILYSYEHDKKIYPASLTKMMTAYIVFDALKNGTIGLNDEIKFKNNERTVTINDLIMKMVVSSSNHATETLAYEISGNLQDFVMQMNDMAKKIGMKDTNFTNTHGLFNEKHYSTARDIVLLAIRMVFDFPKYSEYFSTANYINENGNFKKNTSNIQQNIIGIEGGKTGYIDASGYNIVAWGTYGNKRIFIVIIGADNKIDRDALVIKLINNAIGENIENTIHSKNAIVKYNKTLRDILFFLNINADSYMAPSPIERKEQDKLADQEINLSKKNNKYFYKRK